MIRDIPQTSNFKAGFTGTCLSLQPQKRIEREGSFQEVEGAGAGVVDDEFGDLTFVAAVDVDFDFAIA